MKKSIDRYRLDFLKHLEEIKGYSPLSVKTYDEAIKEAFLHAEMVQNGKVLEINLMPYRVKMANLKSKTITKKLSAIRTFVKYLNEMSEKVTLLSDESIKVSKTLPKPIPHKYIQEAIDSSDLFEKTVIVMLYTLGLRISELVSLKLSDISDEWIRVFGKGQKYRDVPLLGSTKKLMDSFLTTYMPKNYFFEKNSKKLSENSLRYVVNKVFKRIGMKVTPHQLRHSFASSLLNNGANIVDVSELLGHSSMATTQVYTKLGSAIKKDNYNKAHPLCGVEF